MALVLFSAPETFSCGTRGLRGLRRESETPDLGSDKTNHPLCLGREYDRAACIEHRHFVHAISNTQACFDLVVGRSRICLEGIELDYDDASCFLISGLNHDVWLNALAGLKSWSYLWLSS